MDRGFQNEEGSCAKPGSGWDYALLGAAMAANVPFVAANIVVFLHRKRSYFRAQGGAPLILTSSIAGLIWIGASFVINLHFPRNHHFLLICPLWSFWLELTFGFWLWLDCQVVRLLHLHHLCQNAASTASVYSTKRRILLYAVLLWIPGLAVTIVASATRATHRVGRIDDACADCKVHNTWKWCMYIILPLIYFGVLGILLLRSKSIKDYMMAIEYSHTFEYSFMMVFLIYLLYGVPILTSSQNTIPGRCFLTFCVCCIVFINFWVRLGRLVYLCACKCEAEIDSFEEELRCCGAECLDKLSSATGSSQAAGRSSSTLEDGDWILRAIDATMSEASECKAGWWW